MWDTWKQYSLKRNVYGWTPLHIAVRHGHTEIVSFLISKDADINSKGGIVSKLVYIYDISSLTNLIIINNITT